jgi:hypothetical protein
MRLLDVYSLLAPIVLCKAKHYRHEPRCRHPIQNSTKMSNAFTFFSVNSTLNYCIHYIEVKTQYTNIVGKYKMFFILALKQEITPRQGLTCLHISEACINKFYICRHCTYTVYILHVHRYINYVIKLLTKAVIIGHF